MQCGTLLHYPLRNPTPSVMGCHSTGSPTKKRGSTLRFEGQAPGNDTYSLIFHFLKVIAKPHLSVRIGKNISIQEYQTTCGEKLPSAIIPETS